MSPTIRPHVPRIRAGLERRADELRYRVRAGVGARRARTLPLDRASVVLGTGRSGTTWLMEILGSDPRYLPVFEPLHREWTTDGSLRRMRGFQAVGRDESDPILEAFLREVLQGHVLNRWTVRDATVRQILQAERTVVKMIRLCGATGWFEITFPQVPVVALMRHPCAVVASMRRADGGWRQLPSDALRDYAAASLGIDPDLLLAEGEMSEVRRFATLWAVDNAALLRDSTPERTLLVGFEELLADPESHLPRITAHLGLDIDLGALDLRRASSTTARAGSVPASHELGRWRSQLTLDEIDTVLEIAHTVGLTIASANPEPDMDGYRARQADRI